MKITPFATEHFFAKYEFSTPHQLCNSDCETVTVHELLAMAGTSLEAFGELSLGYTESQGSPALRQAIAADYDTAAAEDIVILGSPVEGIYLAARALLEPGDEVVVLNPAYDALINLFEHVAGQANVKKWRFAPTAGGWDLNFDALQALLTPQTKLLVLNFPHNPTGFLPTGDQLNQIIELAEQHDLWLFYDEMYFGLIHSGTAPIPSAADLSRRAVVLSGLSKTYGLPGLRTGWLVIQDKALRDNVMNWKFYTSICPPAPSEFLALVAWQVRDRLRRKNIAQIEHNLALAEDFFQRWPELFVWKRPLAGSVALVKMNIHSVSQFSAKLAAEAGVLIHPATTLGSDDHHMRMGFGRKAFDQALLKFDAYLKKEPPQ